MARFLLLSSIVAVATLSAACDEVAKVADANNQQPGEADGRAVELGNVASRLSAVGADATSIIVVAQNGDVWQRARTGDAPLTKIGNFKREERIYDESVGLDAESIWLANAYGLYRMPRAGGEGTRVDANVGSKGIAVAADSVIVASLDKTKLLRIDKNTKAVSDLAVGFTQIEDIILDGDRVDVADREAETISAVPIPANPTELATATVLAKDQSHPQHIGIGPDYVYWANAALSDHKDVEDRLMRVKRDGSGAPEPLASTKGGFSGPLLADGQFVYGGEAGGGLIRAPLTGGEKTKFLNAAVADFVLLDAQLYVVENNGYRFSEAERTKPNRLLGVTK